MDIPLIIEHYVLNRQKLVKRMTFRVGSSAAAEDIIQTAYERALRYHSKGGVVEKFDQWFGIVLRNALCEYQNNEKGYSQGNEEDDEHVEGSEAHFPDRIRAEILWMIEDRSKDHQEILTMYFQQEYSAKDISQITEYSYAKVHQTIQRFRNELKEIYKE